MGTRGPASAPLLIFCFSSSLFLLSYPSIFDCSREGIRFLIARLPLGFAVPPFSACQTKREKEEALASFDEISMKRILSFPKVALRSVDSSCEAERLILLEEIFCNWQLPRSKSMLTTSTVRTFLVKPQEQKQHFILLFVF
ncbi:hypothetical protein MUK42_18661 [Musa troglodytarum]|uniref:Secreted protein n=1 Tax=Musa troglodytarum TaxID=320322 RepID=A0A9E7JSM8_9LILI|nr:hypothetical protein MUK42_18661 [Musa troglodytarum]